MIKKTNFTVLVRRRNTNQLLHALSSSVKGYKISARPRVTSSSLSLASLSFELEGEELQVDAFRELVQTSPLRYKPKK